MGFNTISVVGLGYIGLPTAAILASRSINVIGLDVNPTLVATINAGGIHIVEPDLDILVQTVVSKGHLRATTMPEPADAFLIAVPTPIQADNTANLSYVEAAVRMIAPVLKRGDLLILESTSPVGATARMVGWLAEERPDLRFPSQDDSAEDADIFVAHCPERVLPGHVLRELIENDRVIGGISRRCAERARKLYEIFVKGECLITTAETAEFCKLTENAFRDLNIAFANELSIICDKLGINVWNLIALANRHPRVNILQPGPGVGGHCIAVDPWFIVESAPAEARLIRTAREVNNSKPGYVLDKVRQAVAGFDRPPVVACLGLTFKPDIDDLRESPALEITEHLAAERIATVLATDPHVETVPSSLAEWGVTLTDVDTAVSQADIVLLLVSHKAFEAVEAKALSGKVVIDTRGQWRNKVGNAETGQSGKARL